jgi:aerobic C4-dicarboxylate transport protein
MQKTSQGRPWYRVLYIQVLIAVVIGILIGWFYPDSLKTW